MWFIHPEIICYEFILIGCLKLIFILVSYEWFYHEVMSGEYIHIETFHLPFFGEQIKFSEFVTRHIGEMEGVILES